jgi:hypothetical protein
MRKRIHKFSLPEPTTTGSRQRPYRKNIRCDKQHGVRTDKLFSKENKELHGLSATASDCELWEIYLLGLEHANRLMVYGDSVTRRIIRSLFRPLNPEDHLRNVYKRLQRIFDPQMRFDFDIERK